MEEEGMTEIKNCHCPFNRVIRIQDVETCLRIQEAIKLKEQGNAYIKQKSFKNAESAYSEAIDIISASTGSPIKFISILYSNRALARNKSNMINLAMLDYYKSIAICPGYDKANLRLIDLLIKYNCTNQALDVIEDFKLISNDNKQILLMKEREIEKLSLSDKMMDYYIIMDLDKNCSKADIKKAYKKLALKFHPDKAKFGLNLVGKCTKVGYDILEHAEIGKRVIKNADTLFRMLNEANEVLNDEVQREKLDRQQAFASRDNYAGFNRYAPRTSSYNSTYDRNSYYSRNDSSSYFGSNPFRHTYYYDSDTKPDFEF